MLRQRAMVSGVANRIRFHKCELDHLGVDAQADFAPTFMMIHEVPDQRRLLSEIRACLKRGGKLLVAEPRLHVSGRAFAEMVAVTNGVGLQMTEQPKVKWCRAVVFEKV